MATTTTTAAAADLNHQALHHFRPPLKNDGENREDVFVPEPLHNQVGGHRPNAKNEKCMLQWHDLVLKPVEPGERGKKEVNFYFSLFRKEVDPSAPVEKGSETREEVMILDSLRKFVPKYCGTMHEQTTNAIEFLQLENITYGFVSPSILDLKMGTQTYDELASEEKKRLEREKYPEQEILGFRFTGMKVYDASTKNFKNFEREYGRSLKVNNISTGFRDFFHNGIDLRKDVIVAFLVKLRELLKWFRIQKVYRFYSSSILWVYEGDLDVSSSSPVKINLRMIDFAHVFEIKDNGYDEGYIKGLSNVINILESMVSS